ncbi:unnamed protein product [Cuscuta epithymum]|uniref:RRM domain-containing protein n=1 Tax=Cuscuta epithymum TaxID=186058 RepID=A0AAV0CK83_9ASTE|nr:unnamed protein product [Cuscuta epithymum]
MAFADVEYGPQFRCFVGGLNFNTIQDDLERTFANYGKVTETKIIKDRETERSRGFGFVTFETEKGMKDAIAGLNGMELDGRTVTVNEAQPRENSGGGSRSGGYGNREGGSYGNRREGGGYRGGRGYGSGGRGYRGSDDRGYGGDNSRGYGGGDSRGYGGGDRSSYGSGEQHGYGGGQSGGAYGGGGYRSGGAPDGNWRD